MRQARQQLLTGFFSFAPRLLLRKHPVRRGDRSAKSIPAVCGKQFQIRRLSACRCADSNRTRQQAKACNRLPSSFASCSPIAPHSRLAPLPSVARVGDQYVGNQYVGNQYVGNQYVGNQYEKVRSKSTLGKKGASTPHQRFTPGTLFRSIGGKPPV